MKTASRRPPWTLADYAAFAEARGGKLLTVGPRTLVPRAHDKLHFRCQHGHEWTPHATGIKTQGYWCFRCARGCGDNWTIADYRCHAEANGGELVDTRPDSDRPLVTERIRFRCAAGHEWTTVGYSVSRDRPWCRICRRTSDPWDADKYRAYASERGGKLISRHPAGVIEVKNYVRFRCAEGHEWAIPAWQIKSYSTWCGACAKKARRKPLDDLEKLACERGGELIAAGANRTHDFRWKCSRGHEFQARPDSVVAGGWCPRCSASRSERLVRACFEQLFGKPFPRARPKWLRNISTGFPMELDGYCEPLGVAFEHQGSHHYRAVGYSRTHSLDDIRRRDARKRRICRQRGVALIEIRELSRTTALRELAAEVVAACRAAGVRVPKKACEGGVNFAPVYTTHKDDEALAELQAIAKARGGLCLSKAYMGSGVALQFVCSEGHKWATKPTTVRKGSWCRRCALEKTASLKRLTIEDMQAIARERGGSCLSKRYVRSDKALRWQCGVCRHKWPATPSSIRQGTWCPQCAVTRRRKRKTK
jgi:hypothetical protein